MAGNWSSNTSMRPKIRSDINAGVSWAEIQDDEVMKFSRIFAQWSNIFDITETVLLIIGLLGNLLALITLLKGRHMRTPSFVYHKALVVSYLTYCFNFLMVKYVNSQMTVPPNGPLNYSNPLAAYYAVILNRVITSVCGYLALYTSLAISVDRFLALVALKRYSKFNRHPVAYAWVGVSLLLSVCVHSWAPWLEHEIHTTVIPIHGNHTVLAYTKVDSMKMSKLRPYLVAKDWYNLIVRFAYAILLTILTSTVIYMFTKQQKKRSTLCHVSKRQLRRERSLFYLMIAVVVMAYVQVIPRESKRILELIYTPEYVGTKVNDRTLSIDIRRMYLIFGLYAYMFTTPVLNLCTTIERSLLFYLYFALNHSFRRECLVLLKLKKLWASVQSKLGVQTDSDRRPTFETTTPRDARSIIGDQRSSLNTSRRFGSSDASFGIAAEACRRFLSPNGYGRTSRAGSSVTTCSEYSSNV